MDNKRMKYNVYLNKSKINKKKLSLNEAVELVKTLSSRFTTSAYLASTQGNSELFSKMIASRESLRVTLTRAKTK
jgi:hypothetical protein